MFIVINFLKNTQNFYDHLLQCTQTKMCFNPIHGKPLSTDITELIPSTRKNGGRLIIHTTHSALRLTYYP